MLHIIRMIESRRMKWGGHLSPRKRSACKIWFEDMKKRDHWKDTDVDGEVILKGISKKSLGECGLDSFGSRLGRVAGCFEHGNEPPGFVLCLKSLVPEKLLDSQEDSAPWS
jgi:hypothetical protein